MANQPVWSAPLLPPRPKQWLPLLVPTVERPVQGFAISPLPVAFWTHWVTERREVLCRGGLDCQPCRAGSRKIWHAVLAILSWRGMRPAIIRLTEHSTRSVEQALFTQAGCDWRGLFVVQAALGRSKCAPQRLTIEAGREAGFDLPSAPDLAAWVERLYRTEAPA